MPGPNFLLSPQSQAWKREREKKSENEATMAETPSEKLVNVRELLRKEAGSSCGFP